MNTTYVPSVGSAVGDGLSTKTDHKINELNNDSLNTYMTSRVHSNLEHAISLCIKNTPIL